MRALGLASNTRFIRSRIQRMGLDKYGLTLAGVTVNGKDAGAYLVNLGLARWWE